MSRLWSRLKRRSNFTSVDKHPGRPHGPLPKVVARMAASHKSRPRSLPGALQHFVVNRLKAIDDFAEQVRGYFSVVGG